MKRHLKRLRMPSFWKRERKGTKWAIRPSPGAHKMFESIPLAVILRDILKVSDNEKDASHIIKTGGVMVDCVAKKDPKYSAGLMDTVSIPKFKMYYRIVPTVRGLELVKIDESESKKKMCTITGKTTVAGGKTQLNLHDGRNLLVDGKEKYSTGDSVIIEMPSQKVIGYVKLDKGAMALVSKGKNIGLSGKIEDIIVTASKEPSKIICNIEGDKLEVVKDYVFVVGKDKPMITIE